MIYITFSDEIGIQSAKDGGGLMCHKKIILSLFPLGAAETARGELIIFLTAVFETILWINRIKQIAVEMLKSQRTTASVKSLAFINNPLKLLLNRPVRKIFFNPLLQIKSLLI
jgi:hypothetical protein